jgi:hypothetical protein
MRAFPGNRAPRGRPHRALARTRECGSQTGRIAMSAPAGGKPMDQFRVHVAAQIEFRFDIEALTSGDAGLAARNRARAALSDAVGSPLWALTEIHVHRVPDKE